MDNDNSTDNEITQSLELSEVTAWKRFRGLVVTDNVLTRIENWLNIVGVSLIMCSMAITVVQIIGRYFFNHPIKGETDIVEILMAGIVFLGLAYTLRVGGHVGVDILVDRLKGRPHYIVKLLAIAISIFLFVFVTISAWKFTLLSLRVGDATPEIMLAIWPAKLIVTIGAFFITLRFIMQFIQYMVQLVAGKAGKTS
jgi:TRAP-type C4-dicarboxylate transport system permease small subunit